MEKYIYLVYLLLVEYHLFMPKKKAKWIIIVGTVTVLVPPVINFLDSVEETGFNVSEARLGEFGYDRFSAVRADKWHLGEGGFRLLRRLLHLLKPAREVRVVAMKK